jgi:hypothetical protein
MRRTSLVLASLTLTFSGTAFAQESRELSKSHEALFQVGTAQPLSNIADNVEEAASEKPSASIDGSGKPTEAVPCLADTNSDKVVSVQDMYDFLAQWQEDVAKSEAGTQRLFDFLNAWAIGC